MINHLWFFVTLASSIPCLHVDNKARLLHNSEEIAVQKYLKYRGLVEFRAIKWRGSSQ